MIYILSDYIVRQLMMHFINVVFICLLKDSWYSLLRIIDWYGDHQHEMIPVAGPGNWNDPDQVQ